MLRESPSERVALCLKGGSAKFPGSVLLTDCGGTVREVLLEVGPLLGGEMFSLLNTLSILERSCREWESGKGSSMLLYF